MAEVINRTTLEHILYADTGKFSPVDWIIKPDMSAVAGIDKKYWKIVGNSVLPMDAGEQAAVDAVEALAGENSEINEFDRGALRRFILVLLDEFNNHSNKINAILNAIDSANNLADVKTAVAAISDIPVRDLTQLKTAMRGK